MHFQAAPLEAYSEGDSLRQVADAYNAFVASIERARADRNERRGEGEPEWNVALLLMPGKPRFAYTFSEGQHAPHKDVGQSLTRLARSSKEKGKKAPARGRANGAKAKRGRNGAQAVKGRSKAKPRRATARRRA